MRFNHATHVGSVSLEVSAARPRGISAVENCFTKYNPGLDFHFRKIYPESKFEHSALGTHVGIWNLSALKSSAHYLRPTKRQIFVLCVCLLTQV